MGTPCMIILRKKTKGVVRPLYHVYSHYDGFPHNVGAKLYAWLRTVVFVDTIPETGDPNRTYAKGLACLAAQLVALFASDVPTDGWLFGSDYDEWSADFGYFIDVDENGSITVRIEGVDVETEEGDVLPIWTGTPEEALEFCNTDRKPVATPLPLPCTPEHEAYTGHSGCKIVLRAAECGMDAEWDVQRLSDGSPNVTGAELCRYVDEVLKKRLTHGLAGHASFFNQLVKRLKTSVGTTYLWPGGQCDIVTEWSYMVDYDDTIRITVLRGGKRVFAGRYRNALQYCTGWREELPAKTEAAEGEEQAAKRQKLSTVAEEFSEANLPPGFD
eukprot:NODE_2053_length_1149_cov_39.528376_g2036_i0.p1 GENE.NODE_2053_length_1149_cov_39.528376_g2036_i0~~NODE_2053_length_1149_cov_39.528376_g2036_i0.p1  ORF type:complete len:329 (+),score=48.75 NODE_2053_length_1149_cov_39.528376_g2036_i0:56-1042(+)